MGIDPFIGFENLVWGPNWKHSRQYAKATLKKLNGLPARTLGAVKEALKSIARDFIAGEIGNIAQVGDEEDDI